MTERKGAVTFKGEPMTLVGEAEIVVGDKAPDFELVATDLTTRRLSDYKGKVVVLSTVPSLDTSVCDVQTRRFNAEAAELGDDVEVLTVSMDLPFAQKRWCGAAGVERVTCLSDYKAHDFGRQYALRIQELGLLARSVTVIDREGTVAYHELVREIAEEPNYDAALDVVKQAVAKG